MPGRNLDARAKLLAADIVYLDLAGLLPSKRKRALDLHGGRRLAAGEWVEIPEPGSALLIERGSVDLVMPWGGASIPVKKVGVGALFGDDPWLGLTVAGAKAIAAGECELVTIDPAQLRDVVLASRAIAERTLDEMTGRLAEMRFQSASDIDSS